MRYELEFSGECSSCGNSMDGFVRGLPRTDLIVLFLCRECDRVTGWVRTPDGASGISEDLAGPYVSQEPPKQCRYCEAHGLGEDGKAVFSEWRRIEIDWKQIDMKEPMLLSAPCWECGKPVRFSFKIRKTGFFSLDRNMGLFMWSIVILAILLSPLLLLLSPFLLIGWIAWRKLKGKCLRCGHVFTSYSSLPLISEDGGGSLRRCPSCKEFYYIPIFGPVDVRRISADEMRRSWPEVDLK